MRCWTTVTAPAWPPRPNAGRWRRCTPTAPTPAARSVSPTARSITSSTGPATAAPPTWPTWCPLCGRHHHLVHEGRWQLQLRAGPHDHPDQTRRRSPLRRLEHQPKTPPTPTPGRLNPAHPPQPAAAAAVVNRTARRPPQAARAAAPSRAPRRSHVRGRTSDHQRDFGCRHRQNPSHRSAPSPFQSQQPSHAARRWWLDHVMQEGATAPKDT